MDSVKIKLAEIKVTFSAMKHSHPAISRSYDAYQILLEIFDSDRLDLCEEFHVLYFNRSNRLLGWIKHAVGGVSSVIVDVRIILATALKANAVGIIISHNHPSGTLIPSEEDCKLTNKVSQASKFFDIVLLDHIIITKEGYFSFADEGKI